MEAFWESMTGVVLIKMKASLVSGWFRESGLDCGLSCQTDVFGAGYGASGGTK